MLLVFLAYQFTGSISWRRGQNLLPTIYLRKIVIWSG